jgi:3-hydroxy-9,10-secoandrosta-1,3,5(10)-triene-9,17-dione monooxygenase reductase component
MTQTDGIMRYSDEEPGTCDPRAFRDALGAYPTGVTIVTTVNAEGVDVGVTANSFCSVSLAPPMVLWCLGRTSRAFGAFMAAHHFVIHVLANDQDVLATRFSRQDIDRFAGLVCERGAGGVALIDGCAARLECRMAAQHEGGDHAILVGEVVRFEQWCRQPLVFNRGRFARLSA